MLPVNTAGSPGGGLQWPSDVVVATWWDADVVDADAVAIKMDANGPVGSWLLGGLVEDVDEQFQHTGKLSLALRGLPFYGYFFGLCALHMCLSGLCHFWSSGLALSGLLPFLVPVWCVPSGPLVPHWPPLGFPFRWSPLGMASGSSMELFGFPATQK